MAVFNHMPMGEEGLRQVYSWIDSYVNDNREIAEKISLGKSSGTKYDRGDMEVIIPANTTRWGMDEQVHQYVANGMAQAAAAQGWPYEIHTLEDLSFYYFGDPAGTGRLPQRYLQEKVFLLHIQNHYEHYDRPEHEMLYSNTRPSRNVNPAESRPECTPQTAVCVAMRPYR